MTTKRALGNWLVLLACAVETGACGGGKQAPAPACEPGSEGCACYHESICDPNLTCLSKVCVSLSGGSGGRASEPGGAGSEDAGAGNSTNEKGGRASVGGNSSVAGNAAGGGDDPGGADTGPTPVSIHGALSVSGTKLRDAAGKPVKLEGMSTMWLNWDSVGYAESKQGLRWMRDNWDLRILRAAMGVEPAGAYLSDPAKAKSQIDTIVQNAIDVGVYVIIDWHDHNALSHQAQAQAFFDAMSLKWGAYPNVLYEVFNEPLDVDWASELKPYHQSIVNTIRHNDPDNVILLGTPNWDQDVDLAATSPLSGVNLMYTLHFYACTHQARERSKAKAAYNAGLPLFVSEWGATAADGGVDGIVCEAEARSWHDFLDQANISWTAWKLDGCSDSSCMFKDQTAPVSGGWTAQHLNGHAPIVIDEMKNDAASLGGSSGSGGSSGLGGKNAGGSSSGGTGSGGMSSVDPFPPNPAACALVDCVGCCSTAGVFALDALSNDVTSSEVTGFNVSATAATAQFSFAASDEVGAIFFKLASDAEIGSLGISAGATGGSLEVALVHGGGVDGCIYPIEGGNLSSLPSNCWGDGAGPYSGLPVDQIEVRVRSLSSRSGSLTVESISYGD